MVFGSSSGSPQLIKATTNALWVSLQGVAAGTGTGTFKPAGTLCDSTAANCSVVAYSDAATINQWNVFSLTVPASTLVATGSQLKIHIDATTAANANTKVIQTWWGGGTCSGTGASCCASGQQVSSIGTSGSGIGGAIETTIRRTGASTQVWNIFSAFSTTITENQQTAGGTQTETNALPFVMCARNTAASAATLQGTPRMTIDFFGQ
jgi:hypothetical protein